MTTTAGPPTDHKSQLGRYGETCAARFLTRERGMVLLDRNWRTAAGEIDLVLRDRRVLVICEVKTRSSLRFGDPLEAVTEQKTERLKVLAAAWCEHQALRASDVRIDLVGVLLGDNGTTRIEHVMGVGW